MTSKNLKRSDTCIAHQKHVAQDTYEAWTGLKPNVGQFKVFWSMCFRHVPEQMMTYLNDDEVLKKLGLAMGIPTTIGEVDVASGNSEPYET